MNPQSPLGAACPDKLERRMERAILHECEHPAVRHPLTYSLDASKQLLLILIASALSFLAWRAYIGQAPHAVAPNQSAVLVHLISP